MPGLAFLREAGWLTPGRAAAWCTVMALTVALLVAVRLLQVHDGLDPAGNPVGTDFVSFWTASRLALDGRAADAYVPATHAALQRNLFPASLDRYFAFFYPPGFLLLILPLGLLPYFWALGAWLAGTLAALFAALRRLLPQRWAILPILAFPGVLENAGHGQNGFLSAACLGWFMALPRHPFAAGLCLGLLSYKPQLLAAAPIVLLAARRWRAIAGCATGTLALAALSWLVLGADAWRGFLADSALARETLEQGLVPYGKMVSSFAAARLLGAEVLPAYAVQLPVSIAALAIAGLAAFRRPGHQAEVALLVVASLVATPFALSYDLVCLAVPLAWMMAQAQRGWLPWEKAVLLAAYALPMIARPLALEAALPLAPPVLLLLLLAVARRARLPFPSAAAGR